MATPTLENPPKARKPASPATKLAEWFATGFGAGYAPKAPGTFGSIPGLILGALVSASGVDMTVKIAIAIVLSVVSLWAIHVVEQHWDTHDDPRIVCDEVVGQMLAVMFVPPGVVLLVLGFVLFRVLDIWKPGPIGWADDKLPGAWGTFLDDLIAGAFAAGVLVLIHRSGILGGLS